MAKPSEKFDWAPNAIPGLDIIKPPDNKILIGWLKEEKPPFQFFNWLFRNIGEWLGYIDTELSPPIENLLIGSRRPGDMVNIGFFITGVGNGILTIKQANGNDFADTDGNRGYVWLRSATSGQIIRGKITSNVSIPLVGMAPGVGGKGDITSAILRVYAINDGNSSDEFTLKWGICYQGGFNYIRNTQDSTIAANVNAPEKVLVDSDISNDNSPMSDIGYIVADFDDTGNVNGEDFWTINAVRPGESADGIWQFFNPAPEGFSSAPFGKFRWAMTGKLVHVFHHAYVDGVSNSIDYNVRLPVKQGGGDAGKYPLTEAVDNGVTLTTASKVAVNNGSDNLIIYKTMTTSSWTAAGGKRAVFSITYEAHQP